MEKCSKQTAVVIPCHNNETTIGTVIDECKDLVDKIIVINDGSTDRSADAAVSRSADVHSLANNCGFGYALKFGIRLAFEAGYSLVVTLDADGAHNPQEIPLIIKSHLNDSNVLTIGNRWAVRPYDTGIPSAKWWANKFATHIVDRVSEICLPDVACGFRVLSNRFIDCLPTSDGFGFSYELIFLASRLGRIGSSPVEVRYDARELLLTKQGELLDLITSCCQYAKDEQIMENLKVLERLVRTWETLKLIIHVPEMGRIFLIAHPVEQARAYDFQRQHEFFCRNSEHEFLEL